MMRAAIVVLALVAASASAQAQPSPPPPPSPPPEPEPATVSEGPPRRTIVSIPVFALSWNAFAIQAEQPLWRHISGMAAIGIRDGADGDYQSTTVAVGGELRFWLRPHQRGWFGGGRIEAAVMRMSAPPFVDTVGNGYRTIGTTSMLTEGLVGGYRLVLFRRVDIVPTLGLLVREDFPDNGIPADLWITGFAGLELGWVFQ